MGRIVTILAAGLLVASVAGAADIQGKIKTWDPATKMMTLEDGTQLSIATDAKMMGDQVKEGSTVKASYDGDTPRVPTIRRRTAPSRRVAADYGVAGFGTSVPGVAS